MSAASGSIGRKLAESGREVVVRLRVGREAFGEAVAFVGRALSIRPVIPTLSGILLDAAPGELVLSCFDYEVSARIAIDAEVTEPGTALVPGRLLVEIARVLPANPVEIASDSDLVNLVCGPAEFGLVGLPVADYPTLPKAPEPVGVADSGALALAVAQVAPAASRDDTLPMLTAICLDVTGPAVSLVATDRYRLAVRVLPIQSAAAELRGVALVPARCRADAVRAMPPGQPVGIAFAPAGERPADGLISLSAGGRRLTARLIAGEFVKYRSRFPESFGCRAEVDAGPIIDAVRRSALVAERVGPVRLTFGAGQVTIEAHAAGRARAVETIPAQFAGDQPAISFNPHYLLDGLTAAAASGTGADAAVDPVGDQPPPPTDAHAAPRIRIEFTSPARPALVTWVAGEAGPDDDGRRKPGVPAFRYLLVPLRVPADT